MGRFALSGVAGVCLMLAGAVSARSEMLAVTQVAIGMECTECARRLRLDAKKLDGVEDLSTSWNRRVLTLRLVRGNKCTLAAVRQLLREHHFVPGEAEITVAGHLARDQSGRLSLRVSGSTVVFPLEARPDRPSLLDGLAPGAEVVVHGRVAGEAADPDPPTTPSPPLWILDVGSRP